MDAASMEPCEGSDRALHVSPGVVLALDAAAAYVEAADGGPAVAGSAATEGKSMDETPDCGTRREASEANMLPEASKAKMEVAHDGSGTVGQEHAAAAPAACEVSGEVEGMASALSQTKMEVDEGSVACQDHSVVSEANRGSIPGNSHAADPAVSIAKMEPDDGCIVEQGRSVAAVSSEVKIEEGEGKAVNKEEPATPARALPVKEEAGECLVGRYVGRSAPGHVRILIGKVASYDSTSGVYSVVFEDGHGEELGLAPLRELLMAAENGASGMKISCRKRKLDLLVSASEVKGPPSTRQKVDGCEMSALPDAPQQSVSGSDMSEDVESSSNSSDFTKEEPAEPCSQVQAVELPPSSGDIAVPEESISHLLSVYNFLRSFSVQLFLSPFGLDDFVAALNCTVQNNLLDAVHVSLLRALRRHLETKSSEGSQPASDCLKHLDWTLLDSLTWPTFLLEYLYVTGHSKDLGGQSFVRSLLAIEYYRLPVAMKLRVLQMLCDHAIDSEELKTELEDREGYNEEMEYETDSSMLLEAGSRAVSTRAAKVSAYKRMNGLEKPDAASNTTNSGAITNTSQDGNSDDCRICGMDGTLVCCDGCPWAYHSRCIGINKAFLPQGEWFCPECVVSRLGPPSSRIERGARGAQVFGVDVCGRLFAGSCNYLLVIGTCSSAESYARYYNHHDVVKVLQILVLSDAYMDICRGIKEYWKNTPGISQIEPLKIAAEGAGHTQSTMSSYTPMKVDISVCTASKDGGEGRKTVIIPPANAQHELVANQYRVPPANEERKCVTALGVVTENGSEVCRQTLSTDNIIHNTPRNGPVGPSVVSSSISRHNGSAVTSSPNIAQAQTPQSLFRPDLPIIVSGTNGLPREGTKSSGSAKAESFCPSYQGKNHLQMIAQRSGNISDGKSGKLSSFKPQAYINLYTHGSIAALAAANLALVTSDEGKIPASQMASNPRKKMAANNALQIKAFSSAAAQFVWPSTDKKLMEVPRDRCGWCLACGCTAIGNKRACFLNMATTNAAKGSARILSPMHVIKNSDSHFTSIVAYLTNMEESLRGLLIGSLQDTKQRERWRQQVKAASNCKTIVPLLLELERNIRGVAFSASWLKLIDDWPMEPPGVSSGASRPAAYQKRGTGGRRGRKRSLASESTVATDDDNSWTWWNRGNISKRILQRGVGLQSSVVRKAARQGGKKRIAGLSYHEGSDFPRRTRQLSWRACVELSKNSSQLALQVRYLDAHIRWREFIPPDQIPSDGKGSDAEFSALRNAVIYDRKVVDNKIRYALKFPNQKHLPVRVTKNILEAENNEDGNGKLWFSESLVPLFMVREFELQSPVNSLPTSGVLDASCFSSLYPRRREAYSGYIFSYLFNKGIVYSCTSCKKDVAFRDAVKCSSCQGDCHKGCTSISSKGCNAASSLICKLCLQKRNLMLTSYNTNPYTRPQQKCNGQQPVTAPKIIFKVGSSHSAEAAMKVEAQPSAKSKAHPTLAQAIAKVEAVPLTNVATHDVAGLEAESKTKTKKSKSDRPKRPKNTQAITYFGLVWKKNKNDNDGSEFRENDIILKGSDGAGPSIKPMCCLCNKAYSPDFLYVRCERCRNWFHGDALQLEEERIFDLVSYRCCRCRRRAIPKCPYSDYAKPEPEISEQTVATSSQSTMLSNEENFALADPDPLLASYGIAELVGGETVDADLSVNMTSFTPGSGQKLSIRRAQTKSSEYLDQAGRPVNDYYVQNQPPGNATINFNNVNEFSFSEAESVDASELLGWDFSQGTAYAAPPDLPANYQPNETSCGSFAMEEFEPQTYFSFTELLEADDTQLENAFGMSTGVQDEGNYAGNFDQQGVSFDEMSFMIEDGSSNTNFPTNVPSPDEVACQQCKNVQPPPDLKCALCGLHIHQYCSSWDESVQPAEIADWRCGSCREWR